MEVKIKFSIFIFIERAVIPLSAFGKLTTNPLAPRYSFEFIRIFKEGSKS